MSKKSKNFHESLTRDEALEVGPDRSFGLLFAVIFTLVGAVRLHHEAWDGWFFGGLAALTLALALVHPAILHPLNRAWMRFAMLLYRVVSPVAMGLLFFGTILPTGLWMRLTKKSPLRQGFDPDASTYWIPRDPAGPTPESMKMQF